MIMMMITRTPLPLTTTPNRSGRISPAPNTTKSYCSSCGPSCREASKVPEQCTTNRRHVLQGSSLLLSTAIWAPKRLVFAEEEEQTPTAKGLEPGTCDDLPVTKSVFMDVSIDGQAAGRIVIGLYGNDAPLGASRFAELAAGKRGVGYRKKEFVKITPSYIQNAGIRSYGVDTEMAKGGLLADELIEEALALEKRCKGSRTFKGAVGLIVRDPTKLPSQIKLVAKEGKLQVQEEELKPDPNGTEFVIITNSNNVPAQLVSSTLLIGRVVDGMDVVATIANVKAVQENTASPYFQVAKLIGDKRAVVAERGFNRPYSKIAITKCGELL